MKSLRTAAFAGMLAAATLGLAINTSLAHDAPPPAESSRVIQRHGSVWMPEYFCGIRVSVKGEPGTRVQVFIAEEGQTTALTALTIPRSGYLTIERQVEDCEPERPATPVAVFSHADSPVQVQLEFF